MRANVGAETERCVVGAVPSRLFDTVQCGLILFDDQRQVISLNAAARRCLGAGLAISSNRLFADDHEADAILQALLGQACGGEASAAGPPTALRRAGACPLVARTMPLGPAERARLGCALVLVLLDPERRAEPSVPLLQQMFGITRAEARVAQRLTGGASPQDIARATGVSIGTVRSQTKALLAKTGTRRQSDLVGLLTRLALLSG